MKHSFIITMICACSLVFGACANNKTSKEKNVCKKDTVYGLVGPGTSMHALQVCQIIPADTIWFVIDDSTNVQNANLLIGNAVEVVYHKTKESNVANLIIGDATYANAVGSWVMPDPIDPKEVMGVEIDINGKASSIRMATLLFKSWELTENANQIILHGESIGTGETFAFSDTATIKKVDGELTLHMQGTGVTYKKEL